MSKILKEILNNETFEFDGHTFDLSPEVVCILHHWNFGTSADYYRDPSKYLLLPNQNGKIIKITNISRALDLALQKYNLILEKKWRLQN